MKGGFSRFTFDPTKHYAGVLHQQGRVLLDSDWNEEVLERLVVERAGLPRVAAHLRLDAIQQGRRHPPRCAQRPGPDHRRGRGRSGEDS